MLAIFSLSRIMSIAAIAAVSQSVSQPAPASGADCAAGAAIELGAATGSVARSCAVWVNGGGGDAPHIQRPLLSL